MVTSAAAAVPIPPKPAVSAVAPVAARTCRRFIPSNLIVMSSSRFVRIGRSLFLLHPEFADCSLNVAYRLCDDLPQPLRCRGLRQRAALLDQVAVVRRRHDRDDMTVEQIEDRLRRALGGANAEEAVAHIVD